MYLLTLWQFIVPQETIYLLQWYKNYFNLVKFKADLFLRQSYLKTCKLYHCNVYIFLPELLLNITVTLV